MLLYHISVGAGQYATTHRRRRAAANQRETGSARSGRTRRYSTAATRGGPLNKRDSSSVTRYGKADPNKCYESRWPGRHYSGETLSGCGAARSHYSLIVKYC
jgi:hypothetical protein